MNVTLPENKLDIKAKLVYASILAVCIVSISLVLWSQFFEGTTVTTVGNLKGKSDEGYEVLKSEFDDLFTNSLQRYDEKYESKKIDKSKEMVYTSYSKKQNVENNFNIDVNIPYINIKNSTIDKYNKEIESVFKSKAEEILKSKNKNSIYTVVYSAYVQDGILSLVIKANLKEGANAQRVIIKTYNYSLDQDKEVDFKNILNMENVEDSHAQNKIDKEIKNEQKKAEDLKSLGYPIYERNSNDEKYKVSNVNEFYFHDGSIYIIFAYGNDKLTSEVDIAII